ncbi:MAG: methyltransferase [Bacteroidetes bacterium]|jgi:predicted O-methyltransferase YrrM|nr:methyltransferase [Bacteroidota bacterium]
MEFISEELLNYCEKFTSPENDLLAELNRQTHLKISSPRMLSGHLQGRFLSFISTLLKPSYILEIGTYTGYSALCLAEGLSSNGKLYTIDPNEETNRFAKHYFNRSEHKNKIELLQGDAQEIIPTLNHTWDLVFIDADKRNYSAYFDLIVDKVSPGGLIIADNVLWSGKVLNKEMDKDTEAIHDFNRRTSSDSRVEPLLLPVRDGLMVLRKVYGL